MSSPARTEIEEAVGHSPRIIDFGPLIPIPLPGAPLIEIEESEGGRLRVSPAPAT